MSLTPNKKRSSEKRGPILIGVAGPSGSGKTWLVGKLQQILGKECSCIGVDQFYRDRSHLPMAGRARVNYDHPRAIDWGALETALEELRAGRPAPIPIYDYEEHRRVSPGPRQFPKRILLVEGLWVWRRRAVNRLLTLKVFLDCPENVRLERRLLRDQKERGRNPESIRKQYRCLVTPMEQKHVLPQRASADLVLQHPFGEEAVLALVARIQTLDLAEEP